MSPSPEAQAIHAPLDLVASIYASTAENTEHGTAHPTPGFFRAVSEHFSSVLRDHADAIPTLEHTHQRGRLVRFRCMIQDTGLANEVYIADVGGDNGRGCCAYSEGAAGGSPIVSFDSQDFSKLRERQVVYATSVPGDTDWYKRELDRQPKARSALAEAIEARLNLSSSPPYVHPEALSNKYPLPDESHSGALLKLYTTDVEESTPLKATEIAEFVGVLDYASFPTSTAEESPQHAEILVKTLHVIFQLPESLPLEQMTLDEAEVKLSRTGLIRYLASGLEGDLIAAEWLLLAVLGKVYARRGALALGQLPLNLSLPSEAADDAPFRLKNILSNLLPRLVELNFTIPVLNASVYTPYSRDETLMSGRLQLPTETTVLVNETLMGEGTLKDAGVRNVQALATVVNDQTLAYVFPYSTFTFETDLKVIIVSKGKSLIPVECVLPVVPESGHRAEPAPTPQQLASWRKILRFRPGVDFSIPDDISEHIQNEFVTSRQAKTVTQEDLVRRMTMARLLACTFGKKVLDKEIWQLTRTLDEARKARTM